MQRQRGRSPPMQKEPTNDEGPYCPGWTGWRNPGGPIRRHGDGQFVPSQPVLHGAGKGAPYRDARGGIAVEDRGIRTGLQTDRRGPCGYRDIRFKRTDRRGAAMTKRRQLTEAEHAAVRAYAFEHGRCWKDRLRDDWMNARTTGILQALRNSHGPSWLVSYSIAGRQRPPADAPRTLTVTADTATSTRRSGRGSTNRGRSAIPKDRIGSVFGIGTGIVGAYPATDLQGTGGENRAIARLCQRDA